MRPCKPAAGSGRIATLLAGAATPLDARMVKTGFDPVTYRLNYHLNSLISSGRLARAREVFGLMPHQNAFSLNRMLSGCSRIEDIPESIATGTCVMTTVAFGSVIDIFEVNDLCH